MIKRVVLTPQDTEQLANLRVNPEDLKDDFFDYSKVVVKKPWGYEYLIFANDLIAVWILYLKHGAQTSMHCHPNKKTSLVVLDGRAICSTIHEDLDRSAGEGLLIDKGVFHQTKAVSDAGAFVMEIETPVNKRELVRLKDQYGREGQGYESVDQHSWNTQNYNYLSLNSTTVDRYKLKKRLGRCTLTFKRLSGDEGMREVLALNSEDVISVLRGQIVGADNRTVVEIGDTSAAGALMTTRGLKVGHYVELLIIKKIDHIIKVSDYVAAFLNEHKIKGIFLVPGEATVHLLDSIGRHEGLSFICNQSEKSASLAAEGYTKLSAELSALVVSSGAAGLNVLQGVGNAWIDSTPMLILSGQTRTDQHSDGPLRQLDNKSLNIVDIVTPITKYAAKITDPATIRYHLEKAVHLAKDGRPGPVWIDIPIDIQGMTIDASEMKAFSANELPPRVESSPAVVPEILDLLARAERPVLLAGSGIRLSKGEAEFLELVNRLKIPVLTSRRGADVLPEEHEFFFGRPGVYGQRRANFVIQNADLLLSIGSRLSIPLIGRNSRAFARGARKIVVDIDPHELGKETILPNLAVHMDARRFLTEMLSRVLACRGNHTGWLSRCREWSRRFPPLGAGCDRPVKLMPHLVVSALAGVMAESDIIVVDGGSPIHSMMQSFRFKPGQRFISSTGLELPGFALSGAIGACLARGRGRVLCLCEDRGFQVRVPELQTMVDYKLPVKMFVLRSRGNSNVRKIQRDYFGERYVGTDKDIVLGSPALAGIARAYQCAAFEVTQPDELVERIHETLSCAGPAICEVQVEDDQDLMPRIGFTVKEDGKWIAKPLEDMYPYLDRETLKENMIVDLLEED
ncbi:MAG: hypothetical protein HY047_20380 [Acidobacteria bacterium]|nr:hypothetical protein [Acidobacteriota bacterium]